MTAILIDPAELERSELASQGQPQAVPNPERDITIVTGVDAQTIGELCLTMRTWEAFSPGMFAHPWVLFYDRDVFASSGEVLQAIATVPDAVDNGRSQRLADKVNEAARFRPWGGSETPRYAGQREKMLTGYVYASQWIDTPYWAKIDTDATREISHAGCPIFPAGYRNFDIVASPWGYTKPANQMAELFDWAQDIPSWELPNKPVLYAPTHDDAKRVRHPRWSSWVSLYRTDFTERARKLARYYYGVDRIPVPSQDGYHFYTGELLGARVWKYRFKSDGWRHWVSPRALRRHVQTLGLI